MNYQLMYLRMRYKYLANSIVTLLRTLLRKHFKTNNHLNNNNWKKGMKSFEVFVTTCIERRLSIALYPLFAAERHLSPAIYSTF